MASYVGTPSVAGSASSVVNVSVDDGGIDMAVTGGDALEVEGGLVVPSTTATANGGDVKHRFDRNVEEDADAIKRPPHPPQHTFSFLPLIHNRTRRVNMVTLRLPKFNPNGFFHTHVPYLIEPAVASPEGERTARPALVEQKTKPFLVATPKQSGTQESKTAEATEEVAWPIKEEGGDEGKEAPDRTSPVDISADTPISPSQQDSLNTDETGSKETSKEGLEEDKTKSSAPPPPAATPVPKVSLAVVTADREGFEKVRYWASKVINTLSTTSLLTPVFAAAKTQDILCSSLGIPGLRHFIYKSRSHVPSVVPGWEDPYVDPDEKRRLITLYENVHDAVHARSGQPGGPLKLYSVNTEEECILGWITTPFELYVTTSPKLPKSAVVSSANALSRWVKKHEGESVLRAAPVF
ncbi:Vacuolar fusion protein mon1 [Tulasnella sp. 424]|nr:Vacuolar fusion protein mon1 [Tulasnella sp. 424]KAG8977518.1 Vacuolar fusion protein mon1 [Tulasnella sp. 425]